MEFQSNIYFIQLLSFDVSLFVFLQYFEHLNVLLDELTSKIIWQKVLKKITIHIGYKKVDIVGPSLIFLGEIHNGICLISGGKRLFGNRTEPILVVKLLIININTSCHMYTNNI